METNHRPSNDNGEILIANPVAIPATPTRRPSWRRRTFFLAAIPVLVGALSFSLARANGFGGPGMFAGGFVKERMDHLLTAANATEAQKVQIRAIWAAQAPQLQGLRQQHGQLRREISEALAAPTIDPARIEQLRKQSVQAMDSLSTVMTQAIVSSAQVLTPAQRQTVLQQVREHKRHHSTGGDKNESE